MKKPFSKSLYQQYDEIAKKYAHRLLSNAGFSVRQNPDKYSIDIIVSKNGKDIFMAEVEIKTYIKPGEKFKFDTLNIPSRKKKFLDKDLPVLFMLFSECGKSQLLVWDIFVKESPENEVENRYVSSKETFFQIPMSNVDVEIEKAIERAKRKGVLENGA